MSELSPTTPALQQQNATPDEGTDNLLKRFAVAKRVSLLVLLITIALLLTFILASFFIEWLEELSLGLIPIAIPLAFIIIRLIYRQLKDTNVPLYVVTLVSILPVAEAIHLDNFFHHDISGLFNLILKIIIAGAVFALALFLTGWGYLCYQITMMTKYRQQISALMLASTVVAAIIVIPLTIMVAAAMMRIARGEDFLLALFDVIFDVIDVIRLRDIIDFINFL